MAADSKPENSRLSPEARAANRQEGYSANNPEPMQFHQEEDPKTTSDVLHAAEEYMENRQ